MSFTEEIADSLVGSKYEDIPSATIAHAKAVVLDYISCVLAGSTAPGVGEVVGLARNQSPRGQCTVLVLGGKSEPTWAAMVNSAMGHANDFDDTYDSAVLHTSTVVVPAALAAAEATGSSGKDFLHAVTLGMDLHCRLGQVATVQPAELGWIYTPLLGVFGAAAASAKLLRLDREKAMDALGIAYSMASGNHQALNEGTLAKRLQPAFASSNGLLAAFLSQSGITGPHQPFEGTFGLFNVYLRGKVVPSRALLDLGEKFLVDELSLKPYPCCRHTHAAIDGMVEAYGAGIRADQVEEVQLQVNSAAYAAVCEPEGRKYAPQTIVDAQFSLPYTVACALAQGWVYLDDFTPKAIARRNILELASKVKVSVDRELGAQEIRNITPAKVLIKQTGGKEKRIVVRAPKGSPVSPMSDSESRRKLSDCASHSAVPFDDAMLQDVLTHVMNLDRSPTVAELTGNLSPATRPPKAQMGVLGGE